MRCTTLLMNKNKSFPIGAVPISTLDLFPLLVYILSMGKSCMLDMGFRIGCTPHDMVAEQPIISVILHYGLTCTCVCASVFYLVL
ncbi:hypothetical protein GDO81_003499 [Engystomops pustulosus]|uniref:Uncharacterized protein n=1 Tax=Engystomops pustulosus TaxID=76066 RepID=A0AAV7A065_ENGPU|nr:hypothetical protein GDO81_003499 [Engystomops pustulosus]